MTSVRQHSSEKDSAAQFAADVVPTQPWTQPLGDRSVERNIWAERPVLKYVGLDDNGFGRACDDRTGEAFLLNSGTLDFSAAHFEVGTRFRAIVTAAHYVVKVVELLP